MGSATACVALCNGCSRCAFVSYSPRDSDCSWFESCADGPLLTYAGQINTGHCTTSVARSHPPASHWKEEQGAPDPDVRVALVVPVHKPKFAHARNLLRSMLACRQTGFHVIFVVSSEAEAALLSKETEAVGVAHKHHGVVSAYHRVERITERRLAQRVRSRNAAPSGAHLRRAPRLGQLSDRARVHSVTIDPRHYRPESYKKLMGVHYAFSDAADMAHDYAIALDVDTIFQSRRDFSGHFRRWSDRKALITADSILWEAERHWSTWQQGVTTRACRRVGLNASLLGQPTPVLWWNDAPIYERAGFDAFFARVDWTQLSAAKPWWVAGFEHASYACYKALEERWDQLRVHRPLERASSDEQQCASTVYNYSFLWSRNMNEYRLLLIHGDRPRFHQVEAGITSICGEPFAWDGPIHMNRWDT